MTNESSRTLQLGFIQAGAEQATPWSVNPYWGDTTYFTPTITGEPVYPKSLQVHSTGDVVLNRTLELPSLAVTLDSDGAITFGPSAGASRIRAEQLTVEAGSAWARRQHPCTSRPAPTR